VLSGTNVDLAETDGAGGVVFQRSSATAGSGLPNAPIERIAHNGRIAAVVTPPAGGAVQLQTVSTSSRRTTVVYTVAGAAPLASDADPAFPRSTIAARLGTRSSVALDRGVASVGAETSLVSGVATGGNRYVVTYDDAGSGHLEGRAPNGRPTVLPHNPYPSDAASQVAPLAALSPDGRQLATVTPVGDSSQVGITVLNLVTGAQTAHLTAPDTLGGLRRIDFDGRRVLLSYFGLDADGLPSSAPPIVVDLVTGTEQPLPETGTATFASGATPLAVPSPAPDCTPTAVAVGATSLVTSITVPYTWQRVRCVDGWAAADLVYDPPTPLPTTIFVFRADETGWTLVTAGSAFASRQSFGGMTSTTCQQLLSGEPVDCSG
jgi:hypothetical protein